MVGATALALLFGYTTQASASTTQNNCTVTPKKPEILPHLDEQGRKQARFPISIVCTKDRTVYIGGPGDNRQRAYEQDNGKPGDAGGNDLLGSWRWTWNFGAAGGSKVIAPVHHVPNYDVDPFVELFHEVSFRACSADGACGSYTPYEASPVLSVGI